MEEEVTQKTIALSIKTTKVTADVLRMMLRKYLEAQKQKGPNPYKQGKQTYDQLREQGVGLSNIQITDGNIKSFEHSILLCPSCIHSYLTCYVTGRMMCMTEDFRFMYAAC